jgi:hypothetical protein
MPIGGQSKDEPDDVGQESCEVDHERHERHQDWEDHDDCDRSAPPSDSMGTASKRSETFDLLSDALRLETYIQDAEGEDDHELAEFFRRAQNESRKGAEQGKQLLASRIASSS